MEGLITVIQRMSVHDGPGIRSAIFLKGCNLRCKWCHNPETFSTDAELEWIEDKCINCGECLTHCPSGAIHVTDGNVQFDKSQCTACFKCCVDCYPEALHVVGRRVNAHDLVEEVLQDADFFEVSGGGITITGGEPMLQFEFVSELLALFKQHKIHTAIETNLTVPWSKYEQILPHTELVMTDLKILDTEAHQHWTGSANTRIIENIRRLDASGTPYILRTPVVPDVNDDLQEFEKYAVFAATLKNLTKYELLPYHPLGESKYRNLGICNPMEHAKSMEPVLMEPFHKILKQYKLS